MLKIFRVTNKSKGVLSSADQCMFLILAYFNLFEFLPAILEKGLLGYSISGKL